MARIASIIVIAVMLLPACGKAPEAMPTSRSTPKQVTPTPTQTVISTSSSTQTPTAVATQAIETQDHRPAADVTVYQLASLSDEGGWALFQDLMPEFRGDGLDYLNAGLWQRELVFARELLTRFPNSEHRVDYGSYLASPNYLYAQYGDSGPTVSLPQLLQSTLQDALNQTGTAYDPESEPQRIDDIFQNQMALNNVSVVKTLPARNLFGDGQPGWAIVIGDPDTYQIILALGGSGPGHYRVELVQAGWQQFMWSEQKVEIQDLNGNGKPEIGVYLSQGGTGSTYWCEETLALYEWEGSHFNNLSADLSEISYTGACMGWIFVPDGSGVKSIQSVAFSGSSCGGGERGTPGNEWSMTRGSIGQRDTYRWDGKFYKFFKREPLTWKDSAFYLNIKNPVKPIMCLIAWAEEAGPRNPEAVKSLETALAQRTNPSSQNLPEEEIIKYLKSPDSIRFELGTWYAMLGQKDKAVDTLSQIKDASSSVDLPSAYQLAAAFLEEYPASSAYLACLAADRVGVTPTGENMANTKLDYACNLDYAFETSVQTQSLPDTKSLQEWLEAQGIPYTGLQTGDVDDDGDLDWLVLLGTGRFQEFRLWALMRNGNIVQPVQVGDGTLETDEAAVLPTAWVAFHPTPAAKFINVYQWSDHLELFEVYTAPRPAYARDIFVPIIPSVAYGSFMGIHLQPAEDGLSTRLVVRYKNIPLEFGQDPSTGHFKLLSSPIFEQQKQIQQIEESLFEEREPATAIAGINALLDSNYPLWDRLENDEEPRVKPYLEYLLGVAYELAGDPDQALQAYYLLWREFPNSPYTDIVRERLVLKK